MGEMAAYYSLADFAFIGGSLLPLGRQKSNQKRLPVVAQYGETAYSIFYKPPRMQLSLVAAQRTENRSSPLIEMADCFE